MTTLLYKRNKQKHIANLKDKYTYCKHIFSFRKVPFYEEKEKRIDYKFDIQEENS